MEKTILQQTVGRIMQPGHVALEEVKLIPLLSQAGGKIASIHT